MVNDTPVPGGRPSPWSVFTPRFVAGLAFLSAGIGMVVGFAISRNEPSLFVPMVLINLGYALSILEERRRNVAT